MKIENPAAALAPFGYIITVMSEQLNFANCSLAPCNADDIVDRVFSITCPGCGWDARPSSAC